MPTTRRKLISQEEMHPVDLAETLESIPAHDRLPIFLRLDDERAGEVLEAMTQDARLELVPLIPPDRLAHIVDEMNPDTVADILPSLSLQAETEVLDKVDDEHEKDIRTLRRYAPHTAGGIMTTNYVAVLKTNTCREAIQAIQGNLDAETIDYVYVVGDNGKLEGVCSIRALLTAKPPESVSSIMEAEELVFVGVHLDQEEVARIVQKYDLVAVPVVNNDMSLVGVVTVDDVIDVIQQEAEEDIFRLAGAAHVNALHDSTWRRFRVRLPWLSVTFVAQLGIAWLIRGYESILLEFWILAAFFPVVMAIGGNMGLQSATLVVRGLATGEISMGKTMKVFLAEIRVGLMIGIVCGSMAGISAGLMQIGEATAFRFGVTVGVSMVSAITFAAGFGTLIPFLCQRFKVDPAIASGPFITTMNDILSVFLYLTLATVLL